MKIVIIEHVLDRMEEYSITEEMVIQTALAPDSIVPGYTGRRLPAETKWIHFTISRGGRRRNIKDNYHL